MLNQYIVKISTNIVKIHQILVNTDQFFYRIFTNAKVLKNHKQLLLTLNLKNMSRSRFPFTITFFTACMYILLLSSCAKDPYKDGEPVLPPITMEGKNTLGFLLDGKVWVPYQENPGLFTPSLNAVFDNTSNKISIEARLKRKGQNSSSIGIIVHLSQTGEFRIPLQGKIDFLDDSFFNCNEYNCISNDGLLLITTFDKNVRIISGTFNLNEMVNSCGDTIRITDGRFDLKF